jgi:imidazolonepropionase-like amidohydrolase
VSAPLVLANAVLWDGTGAPPRRGATVVVRDGRVAAILGGDGDAAPGAPAGGVQGRDQPPGPAADGARVVDLGGRTVLPGLVNVHVHLALEGEPDPAATAARQRGARGAARILRNAERTLRAGVTTVRDLGAPDHAVLELRDELGPRVLAAGRCITMTGGHGHFLGVEADGPVEVARAVRRELRAGADVVKLIASGGVLTPGTTPGAASFTPAELAAGIEEAHKAGRRAAAHAIGTQAIKNALAAGVDTVEHGSYLDEEALALLRARGATLVSTLSAYHQVVAHGRAGGIPAAAVDRAEAAIEANTRSFQAAVRAGVRVAVGTDAGTPFNPHGGIALELALIVEAGLTPAAALLAATRDAALALGREAEIGTVEPGKCADLVVVDGDPLTTIADVARVAAVVRGGTLHAVGGLA